MYKYFNKNLSSLKIAVWGLSFKPGTDDMRQAPSINLIRSIIESGASVNAYDPKAIDQAKFYLKGLKVNYVDNKYDALDNADALVLVTEWKEFRSPDFSLMDKKMKGNCLLMVEINLNLNILPQKDLNIFRLA